MSFAKGCLNEHRRLLANNDDWNTVDKDRTVDVWVSMHAWSYVRDNTSLKEMKKKSNAFPILKKMALMVWDAQDELPLFHFTSNKGLPMSWNIPRNGELDYIKYEIGHMIPISNGGDSHPNNLSFQSGRCNQHMQTSMDMDEMLEAYYTNIPEVLHRISNLELLHQTDEWKGYLKELGI